MRTTAGVVPRAARGDEGDGGDEDKAAAGGIASRKSSGHFPFPSLIRSCFPSGDDAILTPEAFLFPFRCVFAVVLAAAAPPAAAEKNTSSADSSRTRVRSTGAVSLGRRGRLMMRLLLPSGDDDIMGMGIGAVVEEEMTAAREEASVREREGQSDEWRDVSSVLMVRIVPKRALLLLSVRSRSRLEE
jgi:hypothetical protein